MQMSDRTNAARGVAGNIGLRPYMKYPRLGRGIFIYAGRTGGFLRFAESALCKGVVFSRILHYTIKCMKEKCELAKEQAFIKK